VLETAPCRGGHRPDADFRIRCRPRLLSTGIRPGGATGEFPNADSREWHNLRGLFVRVIAAYPALDRIETIILSVHPLP